MLLTLVSINRRRLFWYFYHFAVCVLILSNVMQQAVPVQHAPMAHPGVDGFLHIALGVVRYTVDGAILLLACVFWILPLAVPCYHVSYCIVRTVCFLGTWSSSVVLLFYFFNTCFVVVATAAVAAGR